MPALEKKTALATWLVIIIAATRRMMIVVHCVYMPKIGILPVLCPLVTFVHACLHVEIQTSQIVAVPVFSSQRSAVKKGIQAASVLF